MHPDFLEDPNFYQEEEEEEEEEDEDEPSVTTIEVGKFYKTVDGKTVETDQNDKDNNVFYKPSAEANFFCFTNLPNQPEICEIEIKDKFVITPDCVF